MDLSSLKIDRGTTGAAGRERAPARRARASRWPLRVTVLVAAALCVWLFWPVVGEWIDRIRLPQVRAFLVVESTPAAAAAVRGTAANGYVVAARRAALSSDVPGRIVELNVREGSVVKRGDVVARLYSDEYRAALERAKADLQAAQRSVERARSAAATSAAEERHAQENAIAAKAELDEAKARLAWAEAEFRRSGDLVRTGIGSPRDLDRVAADRDAALAHVASSDSALRAAQAAAATATTRIQVAADELAVSQAQAEAAGAAQQQAQATLDKTDVRAPFDGIVVLKDAEVGEVVSPNVQGGGNARGAVCTMVDFDSLEVQANVPETTLGSVRLGAAADVFLDAFPDRRYAGVVDRIWPTADRQKATVEVRVRFEERDAQLRPEMGVRVVFRGEPGTATQPASVPLARTIEVPEKAVVTSDGRSGVFVLERDAVRLSAITTSERKSGRVVVSAGLEPGQRIVADPPASLRDGQRVRIVE